MTAVPHNGTLADDLTQQIVLMGANEEDDPTHDDVREFIGALDTETLVLLDAEFPGPGEEHIHHLLIDLIYDDHSKMRVRKARLREYLMLIDPDERHDKDINLALIEGLHCLEMLEQYKDMTQGDKHHREVCSALIKVTRTAMQLEEERGIRVHDQEGVVFLKEGRMVKLVMDHPERADQITKIINERQDMRADFIGDMLEVSVPLHPGNL